VAGYSIFIAHAPADTPVAEDLTRLLAETGATVVYGAESSPTPVAQEELERVALAADAYVALLSRASLASPRLRAVTRKYHELRRTDPWRTLLPLSLEPFAPDQLWPFLLAYPRIEALPRSASQLDEEAPMAPEALALGVMQGLRLPISTRLRRRTGIPVDPPVDAPPFPRATGVPLTGSLMPQLHAPARRPWRPPRTLTLGLVAAALGLAVVTTLAFLSGATRFPFASAANPHSTATSTTLTTTTPDATAITAPTATIAPNGTALPQRTAPPAPLPTATLIPMPSPTATPTPSRPPTATPTPE
jgi:hypothetical protein